MLSGDKFNDLDIFKYFGLFRYQIHPRIFVLFDGLIDQVNYLII